MNEDTIPTPVNDPTGSPTGPGSSPVNAEVPIPENGDDEDGEDSEARG